MRITITIVFLTLSSITSVFCQEESNAISQIDSLQQIIDELKLKIELERQKLEYVKTLTVVENPSDPLHSGITMGIGYFTGALNAPLIGKAKIDEAGIVRVLEKRTTITRLFPTITGFVRPFNTIKKLRILKNVYLGGAVGVNEGSTNEGNGFAMAIGGTIGLIVKDVAHFGFFRGFIYDPTVTELPLGFIDGQPAPQGYSPNSLIETKTRNARYGSIGFVFSVSF